MRKPGSPPPARLVVRVGVTGHRPNGLHQMDGALLRERVRSALECVAASAHDIWRASGDAYSPEEPLLRIVSPLAEGADRIVACEALALGHQIECAFPFAREEYERDFTCLDSPSEFAALAAQAVAVFELDGSRETAEREQEAYETVGMLLLKHCDVLLALWDGNPSRGLGGTAEVVQYAARVGLPTLWIRSSAPHSLCLLHSAGTDKQHESPPHEVAESLKRTLAPPDSGSDLRRDYFREKQRSWTPGVPFTLFVNLVGHGRIGKLRWRVPDYEESTRDEWDRYQAKIWEELKPQMERKYLQHYAWADRLSQHYAHLYRTSFLMNYLMGAAAVVCALLGHLLEHFQTAFVLLELALIALVIANTVTGNRRQWHQRWIEYRLLAEQVRQVRFLAPLGRTTPDFQVPAQHGHADPRSTWVNWHFRAIVREAGLLNARLDPSYVASYRALLLDDELASQIAYHEKNAHVAHAMHHRLHATGTGFFLATLVVCAAHLVYHGESSAWLTAGSAAFPAIGAALAAIASQGEFVRVARRSEAVADRLRVLVESARKADPVASRQLGVTAEAAAEVMSAELLDWKVVFQARPIVLPG